MTKQPTQNSIVFLAALGVYLGLIVAGATPGVIAHQAALTRGFDISEEIEVSDDLDKDPESAESLSESAPDKALSFTFDSFFSTISVAVSLPELPEPVKPSGIASTYVGSTVPFDDPLISKINVSNLARAGI